MTPATERERQRNVGTYGAVGMQSADVRDAPCGRTKRWMDVEAEGEQVTSLTPPILGEWVTSQDME